MFVAVQTEMTGSGYTIIHRDMLRNTVIWRAINKWIDLTADDRSRRLQDIYDMLIILLDIVKNLLPENLRNSEPIRYMLASTQRTMPSTQNDSL